jgi:hyperpolarization activated cyclic nucleotide-gated potassium channel 1
MISGSYFGETDIILNRKRKFRAVCETECELYYLSSYDYELVVVREFPHIAKRLKEITIERDIKNNEALEAILKLLRESQT